MRQSGFHFSGLDGGGTGPQQLNTLTLPLRNFARNIARQVSYTEGSEVGRGSSRRGLESGEGVWRALVGDEGRRDAALVLVVC